MTDEIEKNEETGEQQQSQRKRTIEEQAAEIGDVKVSPLVVIVIGAVILIGLIVALIKVVPNAMKDDDIYVPIDKTAKENGKADPDKATKDNYKIVKAPANPKIKIKTNRGEMIVELYEDKAPNTVANFVELCQKKFYNDIRFHRIIKDFMIQTGCPFARGRVTEKAGGGDAGYKFADEVYNGLAFEEVGLLAMANSGPNTNGSQFFITHTAEPMRIAGLNNVHTIFGKVVEGMDVVNKIADTPVGRVPGNPQAAPPLEDVYIISTEILQLRDHEYHVKKLK